MNSTLSALPTHTAINVKTTFRSLHPQLCQALDETIALEFDSVREFALAANLHPTRVYSFLREGEAGSMPRMDSLTEMLRAIEAVNPLEMDQVLNCFIADVDPGLSVTVSRKKVGSEPLEALNARYRELLREWGVEKMGLLLEVVAMLNENRQ